MRGHELTDRQEDVVAPPPLSGKKTDCGATTKDNRLFFNAVGWLMRTGVPWADLPARLGKSHAGCRCFRQLAQQGVWARPFAVLKAPDLEWALLASAILRALQHSAGQKKRACNRVPGPQPGGNVP